MNNNSDFDVYICFDNICAQADFQKGFGFSALIRNHFSEKYILFDTGGNSNTLLHNLRQFEVNVNKIKKIAISHNHHDHAGGLDKLYQMDPKKEIYVSKSKNGYKRSYPEAKIYAYENLREIDDHVYVSGSFGSLLKEQALFCKTKRETIVIIVGCTHPGLENFIQKGKDLGEIEAVIGGFHGFRKFSYLKGINFIGACHCTQYRKKIAQRFPENFRKICVGDKYSF